MTTLEVMRKALEALEHAEKDAADFQRINTDQTGAAITALRAELEGLEPVARPACVDGRCPDRRECDVARACLHHTAPIAPAIPALTDDELVNGHLAANGLPWDFARWGYALAAKRAGVRIEE